MKEQNNGIVVIDGTLRELPILNAWINSSSVFWVKAEFVCEQIFMKIGKSDKSGWSATVSGRYHPEYGMFRFYVPCRAFTDVCETAYRLVCIDDNDSRHVGGEGKLRVRKPKIVDVNDAVRSCLVKFDDGKCREVVIDDDNVGVPVFTVLEEIVKVEEDPPILYSYDKGKRLYFALYGVTVDGELTLELSQEGEEDKGDSYVVDRSSGFYRKVESVEDDVGVEVLVSGDKEIG